MERTTRIQITRGAAQPKAIKQKEIYLREFRNPHKQKIHTLFPHYLSNKTLEKKNKNKKKKEKKCHQAYSYRSDFVWNIIWITFSISRNIIKMCIITMSHF